MGNGLTEVVAAVIITQVITFNKHGTEVGAKTLEQYTQKATNFANQVLKKGVWGTYVGGYTPNTFRYRFNQKYVVLAFDGVEHLLVSFGRI